MTDPQLSKEEVICALAVHIAERLQQGEKAETVRADLVAQGLSVDIADQLLSLSAPGKWERGLRRWVLRTLGVMSMLAGGVLWLGNQIGFFPTFPFAGTLIIIIGGIIFAMGICLPIAA